jgi:hypothetical protein
MKLLYEDNKSKRIVSLKNIAIGIGLIVVGLFIYILGVMFFLDRGLLAIGNV